MTTLTLAGRIVEITGDPDDPYFKNIAEITAATGALEAWARANLRPDAVVIDAGGNIGLTAILLAVLAPQGHVHVFEPLPSNAEHLRRNIAANGIGNCTINAVALGSQTGVIAMHNTGSASHVAVESETGNLLTRDALIPMTTLDRYASEQNLGRVDFVKIDVEGFEPAVLHGASALIERFRPAVWMEFNTWCLSYIQRFDAREFAFAIWDAFDVSSVDGLGQERPASGGDPVSFLHDNVTLHGTVEDILLRLRPMAQVPKIAAAGGPTMSSAALAELQQLRLEVSAMQRSTSWRVTAPLRALRRLF